VRIAEGRSGFQTTWGRWPLDLTVLTHEVRQYAVIMFRLRYINEDTTMRFGGGVIGGVYMVPYKWEFPCENFTSPDIDS
jgi:hypothetical protein